jgi:hypothetical protein
MNLSDRAFHQGFLTGIVIGHLPLPKKLEILHLHYYQKAETNCVATEAKPRLLVQNIPRAYLALHEIEMDTNRWWRQGSGWSLEALSYELTTATRLSYDIYRCVPPI